MNKSLVVVQHHPVEGVGELARWAAQNGIELDVHRADLGMLPGGLDAPCVLLGGPYAANDGLDWLQRERAWLRGRIADPAPMLGICLGAQLVADAMGADVYALDRPETGWTTIDFADGSERLDVLQWHHDGFTLPPGAQLLASSSACPHQIFRVGPNMGIQFHPEWNAGMVDALNAHFGNDSPLPRHSDTHRHDHVTAWFHQQMDIWWLRKGECI